MNRESARKGLTEAIVALQATFPGGIVVELPNMLVVNLPEQKEPWLKVKIVYKDGWQASLSSDRHHRTIGMLILEAWVPAGSGIKAANDILEHFYKPIHMTDSVPGVRTMGAKPVECFGKPGWEVTPVVVPFWFDDFDA